MLWRYLWPVFILFLLLFWAFALVAYYINARRAADDPRKRDILPTAILLAPVTWPLLLFGLISLFIIRAMFFGGFFLLFALGLAATYIVVRLVIVPLLVVSHLFLSLLQKMLERTLQQLEGSDRLKHIFLQKGLGLFILGNLLQLIALLI